MKSNAILADHHLIRQLPKATAFVNDKFELIYASDAWVKNFAPGNKNIFGASIGELFSKIDQEWESSLKDCLSGSGDTTTVHFNSDTAIADVSFECSCNPWYDEQGAIIGLIIQAEDVSRWKLIEEKSKKLQALLNATSEIGRIGSWEYYFEKDNLVWCGMTRKIHEVSNDFVPTLENAVQFYKDGHSRNTMAMVIHEATENGTPWSERLQIVTAKGNVAWVQASGRPEYEGANIIGFSGTFQNIDNQVRSEMKTKESENRLSTLIDNLPLNVVIKDVESRKILVNKSECAYLGVENPKALLGKTDFDLYDDDVAQISRNEDLQVMETLVPILAEETTNRNKAGKITTFLTSKIPLLGENGKAVGLVGISLDISDLKRKEEELCNIINVVSLQNKKLTNFAHIVSHNLRSHAANFAMLLEFLNVEKDEMEKINILRMLSEASGYLMESLENLNEVVTINTNINLDKRPVLLKDKIDSVTQGLSAYLKTNNAQLINDVSETISVHVIPAYIDSILMNFITNAVKYKKPNLNMVISMRAKNENGRTVLSITDNGLGIDLEQYGDKLFGMYKTFHNHVDARGIGLYITKNQIEAMDGKVSVESEVGTGTTFKIYFNEKTE